MPKIKTKKSASKRFRVTGSGKVKKKNTNTRHLLSNKDAKSKRQARGTTIVEHPGDLKRIKKMMPYQF